MGFGHQRAGRHHAVDQAKLVCASSVDPCPGCDQFQCYGARDGAGQPEQPAGGGNKKSGYTVDCRVRLLDDVPFTNSFRMTMELLHSQPALINYNAATYFYARPGAKIKQPDPVPAMKRPALESPDEMKMDRPVTDPADLRD